MIKDKDQINICWWNKSKPRVPSIMQSRQICVHWSTVYSNHTGGHDHQALLAWYKNSSYLFFKCMLEKILWLWFTHVYGKKKKCFICFGLININQNVIGPKCYRDFWHMWHMQDPSDHLVHLWTHCTVYNKSWLTYKWEKISVATSILFWL